MRFANQKEEYPLLIVPETDMDVMAACLGIRKVSSASECLTWSILKGRNMGNAQSTLAIIGMRHLVNQGLEEGEMPLFIDIDSTDKDLSTLAERVYSLS